MGDQEEEEEVMAQPKYEYLDHKTLDSYYLDVCRQMASAQYRPDVIVALGRGGFDFGVKLSNWFDDVPMVPVMWQTRDGQVRDEYVLREILRACSEQNSQILVVDDMNDTGETLLQIEAAIKNVLGDQAPVDWAVAIENVESDFETTWCSREISRSLEPQWFVFPWENWWMKQ